MVKLTFDQLTAVTTKVMKVIAKVTAVIQLYLLLDFGS